MAFADPKGRVGGQHVIAVKIEKVEIFNDRFGVFFFLEKGFATLHDDVGVVVLLDGIAEKYRLVSSA
jgi:hypothetical protein